MEHVSGLRPPRRNVTDERELRSHVARVPRVAIAVDRGLTAATSCRRCPSTRAAWSNPKFRDQDQGLTSVQFMLLRGTAQDCSPPRHDDCRLMTGAGMLEPCCPSSLSLATPIEVSHASSSTRRERLEMTPILERSR